MPSDERNNLMSVVYSRAEKAIESFTEAISVLIDDEELDDRGVAGVLATFFLDSEKKRVDYLNNLLPDPTLKPASEGDVDKLTEEFGDVIRAINLQEEVEDSRGAVADVMGKLYAKFVEEDLDTFAAALDNAEYGALVQEDEDKAEANHSGGERVRRVLPKLGRYALDVFKSATGVTLGVATGMVLGSAINRRLR